MTLRPRRTDDPSTDDGLRVALGEANRRYSRRIHFRQGWRGYLWQGRFASVPMDEAHLPACARYVALNPVRAGLVARAEDWRWSSARAHLDGNSASAACWRVRSPGARPGRQANWFEVVVVSPDIQVLDIAQ